MISKFKPVSKENLNDHHLNFIRSLYSNSLKLLEDKPSETKVSVDSERYRSLRLELQKLGFASIYNVNKCTREGIKVEERLLSYLEKRFLCLNDSIKAAYQKQRAT